MKFSKDLLSLGPEGLSIRSIHCGIKSSEKEDLAVIVGREGCSLAAVFTTSQVAAAPVEVSQEHLGIDPVSGVRVGEGRGILISSGNANAATGAEGVKLAKSACRKLAEQLACDSSEILIAQTGLIGIPIAPGIIESGVESIFSEGNLTKDSSLPLSAWQEGARGIMTTDTFPKLSSVDLEINEERVVVTGIAKGVAMNAPSMATMIAVIACDAVISPSLLGQVLKRSIDSSFHCLNIDGCQSTNDTVFAISTGAKKRAVVSESEGDALRILEEGFSAVARELAMMMARDAEGGSKFIHVKVKGAPSNGDATRIARQVVGSVLVKCAMAGECAYWGRVFAEVGAAGVSVEQERIQIFFGEHQLCRDGVACDFDSAVVGGYMKNSNIEIRIELGLGAGESEAFGSDLTHEYLNINMEKS